MAAIATTSINDEQVRMFLHTLLGGSTSRAAPAEEQAPAGSPAAVATEAAATTTAAQQPTAASPWSTSTPASAAAATAAGFVPLRPHPRIDAVHPLGEARSSEDLESALKLYRQIVEGKHARC
jgi:hypothetical protein